MIVNKLKMENIRSYRKAEIEFPRGRTLFEGDIGAGKSTILMAIEFALFGLGSAKAASLLRVGEGKGSVELEFEVNGVEYSVRRALARKAGSIQQVEGRLRGPEGEEDYPASEMKEKILKILNFREPTDPKSRSLIFQYAIYTPQEEMKQIITLRPDLRVQILRRAFGVEEYKVAMENTRVLLGELREKRVRFESASSEIPSLRAQIEKLQEKLDGGDSDLGKLELKEGEEERSLRQLEAEREELREVELMLAAARPDHANLLRQIRKERAELEELAAEVDALEGSSSEIEARAKRLGPAPTLSSEEELKAAIKSLDGDIRKHEAVATKIETKIGEYESVAENRRCPICDREASPEEFVEKIDGLSTEMKANSEHVAGLREKLEVLEETLGKRRDYDDLVERTKSELARVEEDRRKARKKNEKLMAVRSGLAENEKKLAELGLRIAVLEKEAVGLEPLRRRIEASQRELEKVREKVTSLRADMRNWRENIKQNAEMIARKERAASKAAQLRDREIWLEDYFMPTLDSIEKHVMVSINREFAHTFERWFVVLVEDGAKEASVDEEFTPLVNQEGYEQDIDFLSGGERTSVALAYRLALSQMVQRFAEAGPSSLILDEPTDGFSKEQLGKMREILDEIANPQVIIVSHERELESFADQIYRVVKVEGESKITR